MAVLSLSEPPVLGQSAKYSDYKDWLLGNFYYYLCSYCLLNNADVQVEHYEPVRYASGREHDPTNLLLACPTCNGNGGKGDYHPKHTKRRRKPHDQTGHLVADVRADDFGRMFHIVGATGNIGPASGPQLERSAWNIALLKLDLPYRDEARKHLCDALAASEGVDCGHRKRSAGQRPRRCYGSCSQPSPCWAAKTEVVLYRARRSDSSCRCCGAGRGTWAPMVGKTPYPC